MTSTKALRDISKELRNVEQKLDSTNQAIVDLKSEPTKIHIVEVAPDFFMASVTLVSTFLGAYFAYAVNAFGEALKERQSRIDRVNYAINTLVINLDTLLNFKKQFLTTKGNEVTDVMREYTIRYLTEKDAKLLEQYRPIFKKQLHIINEEKLDDVFQKWDELEFPELFNQQSVAFMIDHRPDDFRIFNVVRDQIQTFNRAVKLRNILWPNACEMVQTDFPANLAKMGDLAEFLGLRTNINAAVDLALVAIHESLERFQKYQNIRLASPKIFGFRLLGKFRTIKWSIPKNLEYLMPNKAQYASVLGHKSAN